MRSRLNTHCGHATRRPILPTCRDLGIGFVAYSPLGRGFLTGRFRIAAYADDDARSESPRFLSENLAHNLVIVDAVEAVARRKDVSAAQIALAWVLHQGENIVPIPGLNGFGTWRRISPLLESSWTTRNWPNSTWRHRSGLQLVQIRRHDARRHRAMNLIRDAMRYLPYEWPPRFGNTVMGKLPFEGWHPLSLGLCVEQLR